MARSMSGNEHAMETVTTLSQDHLDDSTQQQSGAILRWLVAAGRGESPTPYSLFGLRDFEKETRVIQHAIRQYQPRAQRLGEQGSWATNVSANFSQGVNALEVRAAEQILQDALLKPLLDAALRRHAARKALSGTAPLDSLPAQVPCAKCSTSNRPAQRYCSACGESLWDVCYQCSTEGLSCEPYCGGCGNNRHTVAAKWLTSLRERIDAAHRLWQEDHFQAALDEWYRIAVSADWRAGTVAEEAARLWLDHYFEWLQRKNDVQPWIDRAEQAAKSGNWREQLECLRRVGAPFLDESQRSILAHLEQRLQQVSTLEAKLRSALSNKSWLEAAQLLNQLDTLDSKHPALATLENKLARHILAHTKAAIRSGDVTRAYQLLSAVPRKARNAEFTALCEHVYDRLWLLRYLESSAKSDVMYGLLARMAEKAGLKVQASRNDAAQERCLVSPQSTNGVPGGIRPTPYQLSLPEGKGTAGCESAHFNDPCIAVGLALQGLGETVFNTTIRLEKEKPRFLWTSGSNRAAWGLDLTFPISYLVRLERSSQGPIQCTHTYSYPLSAASTGQSFSIDTFKEVLHQISEHLPHRCKEPIILCLPHVRLLCKELTIPRAPKGQLDKLIHYEQRQVVPLPPEEIVSSYHILHAPEDEVTIRVLVQIIPRSELERLGGLLDMLNSPLNVSLQHHAIAMANALSYSLGNAFAEAQRPHAALYMDFYRSVLLFFSPKRFWHRELRLGIEQIATKCAQSLRATGGQVLAALRNPASMSNPLRLCRVLDGVYEGIRRDMLLSLQAAAKEDIDVAGELRVVGPGGKLPGFLRALRYGPILVESIESDGFPIMLGD